MITTLILIAVAFAGGCVCGYLLKRNSPQTSQKIENTVNKLGVK